MSTLTIFGGKWISDPLIRTIRGVGYQIGENSQSPGSSRLPVQKFRVFVSYTYCIVYFILDLAQSSKDAPEGNFFPTVVFYVSRSYKCIVPIG